MQCSGSCLHSTTHNSEQQKGWIAWEGQQLRVNLCQNSYRLPGMTPNCPQERSQCWASMGTDKLILTQVPELITSWYDSTFTTNKQKKPTQYIFLKLSEDRHHQSSVKNKEGLFMRHRHGFKEEQKGKETLTVSMLLITTRQRQWRGIQMALALILLWELE